MAPKGTPKAVVDKLAGIFEDTIEDPDIQTEFEKQSIDIAFKKGTDLVEYLSGKKRGLGDFRSEQPADLPNFPNCVIVIVAVLGLAIAATKFRRWEQSHWGSLGEGFVALVAAVIMLVYVACLQLGLPYGLVTTPALFLLGATLADWQRSKLISIAQMALLFALGSEYVFTNLFSVPLP